VAQSYAGVADLALYLRDVDATADGPILTALLDRVSRFIDSQTGQFFYQDAPASTYLDSGNGEHELLLAYPFVSVATLEIAYYTGAPFQAVSSGQFFMQPDSPQKGFPYTSIKLSNIPTQGQAVRFYHGYQNVRITGVAGWPSVPSEITHLTCKMAARAFIQRNNGFQGMAGNPETGMFPIRAVDAEDRAILNAYRRLAVGIG